MKRDAHHCLADFFKRPANAHVARQSSAAIGRSFKTVMVGFMQTLLEWQNYELRVYDERNDSNSTGRALRFGD
jgi:hypothetical protein